MQRLLLNVLGGRLRTILAISFSLVAAITVTVGAVAISRTITDYLARTEDERVARDMDLARAFYNLHMDRLSRVSRRLARSLAFQDRLTALKGGSAVAILGIQDATRNELQVPAIFGNQVILVLDAQGDIVVGNMLSAGGTVFPVPSIGSWGALPIVESALASGTPIDATEVVPVEFLVPIGLDELAFVEIVDTPKAAPDLYDPRAGTAGLALVSVSPVHNAAGDLLGAVVSMHLFNNDFALVDRVKQVAGVDTATIFFGDLRVSTNALDERGRRAIGTRISQEVEDVVLYQGREYVGRAYVVKEWFITRYEPLYDYRGQVVGSLYVGAREASFQTLVQTYTARIIYIALGSLGVAALIALPISIALTRPLSDLVDVHSRLADGDMEARVTPLRGAGELATLARSFNAMAERLKNAQEQLVQKEKLASVGQLAAGVAHEINNPLGTIMLLADVMYNEAPADDPRREDLIMITEQARRCKGIVFDLLSFARENRVMAQETNVNRLVESVIAEQTLADGRPKPEYKNIYVALDLESRLPVIQADPDQLRQCLQNLMSNAVDAMSPDGGTLTVSTRLPDSQHVELIVSDTGEGMSEETLSQLFTPFFTTKPPGKGTGLGLSIIYGIVKMHRGDIRVQSTQGVGSTFSIVLPVRLLEASQAQEQIGI